MATSDVRRGSALLTVLWISAALAAILFALSGTIRGEAERTSTNLDEMRSYFLATSGVDRAAIELLWSVLTPATATIPKGSTRVTFNFPTGEAQVEIIPETAKLDVNSVRLDQFARLLTGLSVDPGRIPEIVQSLEAWPGGRGAAFSSLAGPTFPGPTTSFQEIEELLAVRGITPDIFYGTYVPTEGAAAPGEARLIRRNGLIDCLSVFGSKGPVDANTADPAVLYAIGMPPAGIQALVRQRTLAPLDPNKLAEMMPLFGPAGGFLRLEGNSIVTIRSTARVRLPNGRLSDLKRSVAAQVKYMPKGYDSPIHVLRWYDTALAN